MGGHGSGRKPDPMKQFIPKRTDIVRQPDGDSLELPNYSGIKKFANERSLFEGGGHAIQEEGSSLTQRTNLNFIGNAITATDDAGNDATKVTSTAITASSTDTLTNKTINDFTNTVHADTVHEEARNESGSTMNVGDAVYQSGFNVGLSLQLITLADSDVEASTHAIGILQTSSLANNENGHIIEAGEVTAVNTSAWSAGDILYVSGSGTTGNTLTSTKPTGTAFIQAIARVLRSHASAGVLDVFGADLHEGLPNIADTKIWIGDTNGVPQQFALSGDATMTAGGVVTIDHVNINSIGTNTHAQIDTHVDGDGSDHADVATNTLKVSNVTTNLSLGTGNSTTEIIVSSDGTNVTLIEADTDNAGLLGADKWDEIVAATTHVADVTGDPHNIAADTLTFTNKTFDANGTGNSITNIENADIAAAAAIVISKTALVAGTNITLSTDTLNVDDAFLKNDAVDVGVQMTLTGDESDADTQYTAQVLYNTDATPPAASGFPIGTIYIQYTA